MEPGSPRLADERVENHDGPSGPERILRTISACSQRCGFCFVDQTGLAVPTAALAAELDRLAALPGPRPELTFSGGEPTIDPRLTQILALARTKGFSKFSIQTNGVMLGRPGFLPRLIESGVTRYRVSFHSHKPATYNKITGSRDQYPAALAGLKALLAEARAAVSVHVVVCAYNYKSLPELAAFVARLSGKRPVGICFTMINEFGHEKAPGWAVDLAQARPFVRDAVAVCREAGLAVEDLASDTAFPPCVLKPAGPPRGEFEARPIRYADDFSGPEGLVGRAKRTACRDCAYDAECFGVPARYARMFGLGALSPIAARG